jgi:deoxyadenosine/deoxycytidine kinase
LSLIVYLYISPEVVLDRIKLKSRDCETGITLEYLKRLYNGYEEFIGDISKTIPVLKIHYDDSKNSTEFYDTEKIAQIIYENYQKMNNIREIIIHGNSSYVIGV